MIRMAAHRLLAPTHRVAYRLEQGLGALRARVPLDRDAILSSALTMSQAAAFCALPAHDQAHLCQVYRLVLAQGAAGDDLLAAALLHDIAKAGPDGRVRLPDRVARVVLKRLAPRLLDRLTRLPAPRWRTGLALAVRHPHLGAERARALGCSERICWLIAHHHDEPPVDDPDLLRLIAADHAAG